MIRRQSLWVALIAMVFAVTSVSVGNVEARGRKKRRGKAKLTTKANVKALKELMGAFKFGMSHKEVVKVVTKQIKERYAEKIAATNDVYVQDKLRKKRNKEIQRFKKTLVSFKGKKGGWDVSMIDDQFKHGTDESMMVHWETHQGRNQRRFFFFHEGQLYKMFIALDTSALKEEQRNFVFFRTLMENRFGQGIVHDTGLTWQTKSFRVDALDKLAFYNAFCLIISDPRRTAQLESVRKERIKKGKGRNSVIQSITEEEGAEGPALNEGADTIDNLLKN